MDERPGRTEERGNRAWRQSRGLGSRRTRVSAFAISVAAHLIAILLYTSAMRVLRPDDVAFPVETENETEDALELIELIELIDPDVERPDDPEEMDDVVAAEADARPPTIVGAPTAELVPPGLTAAERLRPRLVEGRLWQDLPDEFYEMTTQEREEYMLSRSIVQWYDSLAIAEAAEAALTDWTFTDSNGGRWGVADGRIYLGDVSLPLPLNFGTPVGQRDAVNYRLWEFEEIQRQSQMFLIQETWRERAEAIRERRDRERATARPDTIGSR
ncbi:MAG: hypothetical protein AAF389_12610 [Gemmatimonadota bacterium]